ncbi:Homeobox protein HD-10 [Smittium mucronatum]|uniref:Homeobox protein HD-10 n=1 Tax=Smittium mucronatum TaxID=133383 RepID=A0A1R0H4T6_9FUNG|nr:Homeobox protein HD-10 [Smittium mucronatum]
MSELKTSFYNPYQVKHRRRTTKEQFVTLENAFQISNKPSAETRREIAQKLSMTTREVQVWFQNRRAKEKNSVEKTTFNTANKPTSDKEERDENVVRSKHQNNIHTEVFDSSFDGTGVAPVSADDYRLSLKSGDSIPYNGQFLNQSSQNGKITDKFECLQNNHDLQRQSKMETYKPMDFYQKSSNENTPSDNNYEIFQGGPVKSKNLNYLGNAQVLNPSRIVSQPQINNINYDFSVYETEVTNQRNPAGIKRLSQDIPRTFNGSNNFYTNEFDEYRGNSNNGFGNPSSATFQKLGNLPIVQGNDRINANSRFAEFDPYMLSVYESRKQPMSAGPFVENQKTFNYRVYDGQPDPRSNFVGFHAPNVSQFGFNNSNFSSFGYSSTQVPLRNNSEIPRYDDNGNSIGDGGLRQEMFRGENARESSQSNIVTVENTIMELREDAEKRLPGSDEISKKSTVLNSRKCSVKKPPPIDTSIYDGRGTISRNSMPSQDYSGGSNILSGSSFPRGCDFGRNGI